MASRLLNAGCRFEIEILTTGEIYMECLTRTDSLVAGERCENGPAVPQKVDRMIRRAARKLDGAEWAAYIDELDTVE